MLEIFKNTYGELSDSVVREFAFNYSDNQDSKNLIIKIDCRNFLKDEQWERVALNFKGVKAFKFFEKMDTLNQIIFEARGIIINDFITFDFDYATEDWNDLKSLEKSDFFVVSKDFSFQVEKTL